MTTFYLLVFLALFSGQSNDRYTSWIKKCEVNNISFKKVKYLINQSDTISIIGLLKDDKEICGLPCKADWIHLTGEWRPKLFSTYTDITYNNVYLPQGSWIIDNPDNDYFAVVFPEEMVIKGYNCSGGSGPKGTQTSFYRNGNLYLFSTKRSATVNGYSCKGGLLHPIRLHESGSLKSCTLYEDTRINNSVYKKGTFVEFDKDNKLILPE